MYSHRYYLLQYININEWCTLLLLYVTLPTVMHVRCHSWKFNADYHQILLTVVFPGFTGSTDFRNQQNYTVNAVVFVQVFKAG